MGILFLRRKLLGLGSVRGMQHVLKEMGVDSVWRRHDFPQGRRAYMTDDPVPLPTSVSMVVRWGTTARLPTEISSRVTGVTIQVPSTVPCLNNSAGITEVGNKQGFVRTLKEATLDPMNTNSFDNTSVPDDSIQYPLIVRPRVHAQGREVIKVNNSNELQQATSRLKMRDGWYARPYINKVSEYRVYVVHGRVVTVARKTPSNPDAIAWNVAQGGRFDVVRWDDWPLAACHLAVKAFELSGLDFSGVDMMLDDEGTPYVIELNSAPSLPFNSDGTPSYRHKCMAKAFNWIDEHGRETEPVSDNGWRGLIHPSIWLPRDQR